MLTLPGSAVRLCAGITRREWLRVGALSALGLSLPEVLQLQAQAAGPRATADSCILVYLYGGPSQLETFDPKPNAPAEIRGEFGTITTTEAGVRISEHLPMMAQRLNQYAIIRTCRTSSGFSHHGGVYEALTGLQHPLGDVVDTKPKSTDHPNFGSIVAKLAPGPRDMLRFVQLPNYVYNMPDLPGQYSGFLGPQYNPLLVRRNPNEPTVTLPELELPREITAQRLEDRTGLLNVLDRQVRAVEESSAVRGMTTYQQRAIGLVTNPAARRAFDIGREPAAIRNRYGRNILGQSCLLARRLVDAGVKMVTVTHQTWDTHEQNFATLKDRLLPPFDQGLSALLDDLSDRGMAERTLVVVMSEFGRTPIINRNVGRDHWGHCYSTLLSGGGVRGGQVLGQSDRNAGYPQHGTRVMPCDIAATVYQCLGIDPAQEMIDHQGRPLPLTNGRPVHELFSGRS